jgi:tetraacyldisaccharide 4'-kinase
MDVLFHTRKISINTKFNISIIFKVIRLPLGMIYGLMMEARNILYNWGGLKQHKFEFPVIAVGNLTMGGTGKTPFTIYLIHLLKNKYKNIAVVSRGYGRKSKGVLLISDGRNVLEPAERSGDELQLIAKKCPGVFVAAAEKRVEGIELIRSQQKPDIVILDDAYQHRSVWRNLNILMVNAAEEWRFNFPIPAGSFREFKRQQKRADIVVVSNRDKINSKNIPPFKQPIFDIQSSLNSVVDHHFKEISNIKKFYGKPCAAFAGIAHPKNFKAALQEKGILITSFRHFADHHSFKQAEIEAIFKEALSENAQAIFCTEKDLVKLTGIIETIFANKNKFPPIVATPLELKMNNEAELINYL